MPVFHVHIGANQFTGEEKRNLADALNLALHEAMETPMDDRFIIISEHKEDEFFITDTFPDMQRTGKRIVVNVAFGDTRTLEQKRKLAELVTRYAKEKVGIGPDDVSMMMYPLPIENMSFGRGKLSTDIGLAMPWVKKEENSGGEIMAANQIEDRLAIRQNFDKHWVSVDNKDYEVLRTVFSNDAVLEMFLDGKQAIHGSIDEEFSLFCGFFDACEFTFGFTGQQLITKLSDDTAETYEYVMLNMAKKLQGISEVTMNALKCKCDYRKENGEWKKTKWSATVQFTTKIPLQSTWATWL